MYTIWRAPVCKWLLKRKHIQWAQFHRRKYFFETYVLSFVWENVCHANYAFPFKNIEVNLFSAYL